MAEAIGIVQPVKKVMGLVDQKYNSRKTIEDEEKELEEPDNPEEKTFKKRYGDLRRYSQKQKQEYADKITALEQQLDTVTKNQIQLPKTEEELDAWSKEYPDVSAVIETIAIKKSKEQSQELETKMEEINKLQISVKREKAEAELLSFHPDFETIRSSDDFHQWAEEQPKWVQDALYENETDARSAARAIDLYKIDRDIEEKPKSKKTQSNKDAASLVSTKSQKVLPETDGEGKKWRESIVDAMSSDEYEKHQKEILEALSSGNFIYDVSGRAR